MFRLIKSGLVLLCLVALSHQSLAQQKYFYDQSFVEDTLCQVAWTLSKFYTNHIYCEYTCADNPTDGTAIIDLGNPKRRNLWVIKDTRFSTLHYRYHSLMVKLFGDEKWFKYRRKPKFVKFKEGDIYQFFPIPGLSSCYCFVHNIAIFHEGKIHFFCGLESQFPLSTKTQIFRFLYKNDIKISRKTEKRIWKRNGAYDVEGLGDCGMNDGPVAEDYPPRGNYEDIKKFDRLAR